MSKTMFPGMFAISLCVSLITLTQYGCESKEDLINRKIANSRNNYAEVLLREDIAIDEHKIQSVVKNALDHTTVKSIQVLQIPYARIVVWEKKADIRVYWIAAEPVVSSVNISGVKGGHSTIVKIDEDYKKWLIREFMVDGVCIHFGEIFEKEELSSLLQTLQSAEIQISLMDDKGKILASATPEILWLRKNSRMGPNEADSNPKRNTGDR